MRWVSLVGWRCKSANVKFAQFRPVIRSANANGNGQLFQRVVSTLPVRQYKNFTLETLLRRDDDTMVVETFYKRQSVPSFVQTLSRKTMRTRPQHQYSLIRSSLSLSGARQEWDNAVGVRGARVGQPYPLAIDLSGGWTRNIPNHQSCPHLLLILSFAFEVITAINNSISRELGVYNPELFNKSSTVTSAQCVLCKGRCHCIFSGQGVRYSDIFCVPGIRYSVII